MKSRGGLKDKVLFSFFRYVLPLEAKALLIGEDLEEGVDEALNRKSSLG